MCGWLKDRFGLSWQIVPARLYELVDRSRPARADAATQAMLGMRRSSSPTSRPPPTPAHTFPTHPADPSDAPHQEPP